MDLQLIFPSRGLLGFCQFYQRLNKLHVTLYSKRPNGPRFSFSKRPNGFRSVFRTRGPVDVERLLRQEAHGLSRKRPNGLLEDDIHETGSGVRLYLSVLYIYAGTISTNCLDFHTAK
ncbi:unnamed protein product [Dovyalis caffra]|uniref:Uncharacterized protein n=1 Tax=Dovyalis caffra TaxID=77055 RepID=A0AAV1QX84_9ROSI|nr:unnamed protein product [Dovyalis caffra]